MELALILGIQGAALAYALVVGRSIVVREPALLRVRRLEAAIGRATSNFLGRLARTVLVAALLSGGFLLVLHLIFHAHSGSRLSPLQRGMGAWLGVLLGAGLGLVSAYGALRLGVRASAQVAAAASSGIDRALMVAARAGGAASALTEALSSLGLTLLFGAAFALAGGTVLAPPDATRLASEIVILLAGFPLGAALTALILTRGGGTYQTAVNLAASSAASRDAELDADDPRSPTIVGGLVGRQLGETASRTALWFLGSSASNVAILGLALAAIRGEPSMPFTLVFLAFVVRAFFLLASLFAFSVVRADETKNPSFAFARGHAAATVIGLSGVLGASFWLGREHGLRLFLAGALGVVASVVVGLPLGLRLFRRSGSTGEASEALRSNGGSLALSGVGAGFEAVLLPTAVIGTAAASVWMLGAEMGATGPLWTALVGWAALLGSAPFALGVSSAATMADSSRAIAALGALDSEALRRTARLRDVHSAAALARAELITCAAAAALLAALSLPAVSGSSATLEIGLLDPAITWSGALAVALILAYAGAAAKGAAAGAKEVGAEVERQLRRFPREHGSLKVPLEFSPSYKACVDLSARSALRRLAPHALGALLLPAALGFALRFLPHASETGLALRGLTSFVLFAGVAGFTTAFSIDAARTTLCAWRRGARAALGPDSKAGFAELAGTADVLGGAAGPAAHALLAASAAIGLAFAPFMT